jgi:predicted  nucleic acid-binding Zn-ribbon protein
LQDELLALTSLQQIDLEIAAMQKAAASYPKQVSSLEKELGALDGLLEFEKTKLGDLERQKAALEQTISEEREKTKKWEIRLSEQRSSREYSALAREIDIARKNNQTLNEELAELGKLIQQQRQVLAHTEEEHLEKRVGIEGRIAEQKQRLADTGGKMTDLNQRRSQAAQTVGNALLRRYDAVRKKRTPALVGVLEPGTCLGCRMHIPPQLYNMLRTTLSYELCPSCQRIIYAKEEEEETEA